MFSSEFIQKNLGVSASSLSEAKRIWTDSRTTQPGDLFVAILGEKFDGHDFIKDAVTRGAVGAIVSKSEFKDKRSLPQNFSLLVVPHTLSALRTLAKAYRKQLSIPFFAIAGSNGKTTTKEWLWHFLSQIEGKEQIFKTQKSQNSILGIALSLLQIRNEKAAVIEIGIDEPGWMNQHLEVVKPTHGLITTISEEHLKNLKNMETVVQEELKLWDHLQQHQGHFAANNDCSWLQEKVMPKNSLSYSLGEKADVEGVFISPQTLHAFGISWFNPLPGKHNAENMLAALTATLLLYPNLQKEDLVKLSWTTKNFEGEPHRSRWITLKNKIKLFDDCYNANPDSMEKSLLTFLELSKNSARHVVLGDMLDLGEASEGAHKHIFKKATQCHFENIYFLGENFKKCGSKNNFKNMEELKNILQKQVKPKDSVFLKGSRGMELECLIPVLERIE